MNALLFGESFTSDQALDELAALDIQDVLWVRLILWCQESRGACVPNTAKLRRGSWMQNFVVGGAFWMTLGAVGHVTLNEEAKSASCACQPERRIHEPWGRTRVCQCVCGREARVTCPFHAMTRQFGPFEKEVWASRRQLVRVGEIRRSLGENLFDGSGVRLCGGRSLRVSGAGPWFPWGDT